VQVFTDLSASCDQTNSSITTMLVGTKAGAVPICVCSHANQTEANYSSVFELVHKLWVSNDPNIIRFMADDAAALRNSLRNVWPYVRLQLCNFHSTSGFWTYLCTPKIA
jgi:hypothetical protein